MVLTSCTGLYAVGLSNPNLVLSCLKKQKKQKTFKSYVIIKKKLLKLSLNYCFKDGSGVGPSTWRVHGGDGRCLLVASGLVKLQVW